MHYLTVVVGNGRAIWWNGTTLTDERSREVNRVQKVLEDANLKLASVASDVMGVSGRAILNELLPHVL